MKNEERRERSSLKRAEKWKENSDRATSMKRKCIWQYIWPFSASCQNDNTIFRNTHSILEMQTLYSLHEWKTMRYNVWIWKMSLAQHHHTFNIFRCIWKRKSLLSLFSSLTASSRVYVNSIASTHCADSVYGFRWKFVVTFVNVTLHIDSKR